MKSVECRVTSDKAASPSRFTSHVSRTTSHVSRTTSHVSRTTSHVSRTTFHVSRFTSHVSRPASAFTLVEMLVVIAIIAILAALLLPVLAGAHKAALKKQATVEISQIVGGIQQYDSIYGRFPVSGAVQAAAAKGNGDFTYGGSLIASNIPPLSAVYTTNNSEVIAILMNFTNYPNSSVSTINTNYQKNPQQTIFLSGFSTNSETG